MAFLSTIIGKYIINFCEYTNEQERLNNFDDVDVYEFDSFDEFIKFRKKYPEKMRRNYNYSLAIYKGKRKEIINANHYKQFVKLINGIMK